jgi:hypothetical protein
MTGKKHAVQAILLIFVFFLGLSLFINLPATYRNFLFADQAVYLAMTQSIAHDGDLEFTKQDLVRYYRDIDNGPQGIFLKKSPSGKIFYAKSWAYSLFAAPFVRVFGMNGFLVFHAILLLLVLLMGFAYFSLSDEPIPSLLGVLTFLFASVAWVYYVWISPDFFNMCLVFTIVFLWIYKLRAAKLPTVPGEDRPGRIKRFLLSDGSDYLAAFLAGIATFSKPPNVVLMAPLFLGAVLAKRYKKAVLIVVFFLASAVFLFGMNYVLTADWNFMGGERKTFYGKFPFEKEGVTFDTTGWPMTSEGYFSRMLIPVKFIFFNIFYYFFGRFTGLAWYFFPALLFLYLFFRGRRGVGREQGLLFAALTIEILIYIVLMPTNYGGGGGSLANRYFLNIFPLFFFLPPTVPRTKPLVLAWTFAAVFIAQILLNPFQSSANPAAHAKRFPIKALPLELTLYNEYPTNTNPNGFRVPFGPPPNDGVAYFLDDNFHKRAEAGGTWTLGDRTLELILKTKYPVSAIVFHLTNNPRRDNRITVRVDGRKQTLVLQPRESGRLEFPVKTGFKIESNYLHRVRIGAAKGSLPYFEEEKSSERRILGVFFEIEFVPAGGVR